MVVRSGGRSVKQPVTLLYSEKAEKVGTHLAFSLFINSRTINHEMLQPTFKEDIFPGAQLSFGTLFCMLDYLAQPLFRFIQGEKLNSTQIDMPCYAQAHGRPDPF